MKNNIQKFFLMLALFACIYQQAAAQGTAFSYNGQLNANGAPANGSYDVAFTLFATNASGVAIAGPVTNSATGVTNGLFAATIDFGAGVFTGSNLWLQVAVRTNGSGSFTNLSPRQPILPTPYAIYSANAGSAVTATTAATATTATMAGTATIANSVSAGGITGTISLAQLPAVVVTNSAGLPVGQLVTNFAIPATAENVVAVNPVLNKIYLSGGASSAQPIVVVDGVTFVQTSVGNGMGADVDVTNGNYWSGGVYSDNVTVWNSSNVAQASKATGSGCTFEASVDAIHRVVWAGAQCSDSIWAFNADTYAQLAGPISPGGVMGPILVNPGNGRLYFTSSGGSKRVNPSTYAVTANSFGTVIGVNAQANRIYAMGGGNVLQIINGVPDPEVVLTNVTLPFAVTGAAIGVNPALNQIYVQQNTNTFMILDGTSGAALGTVTLGATLTSLGQITVDSSRGRVYVLAYAGGSPSLYVVQVTPTPALNVSGTVTAGSFTGNGSGLTNLTTTNLTGTIADARLSSNVALLNAANTFSANQTVNGAVGIGVAASSATVLHIVSPNPAARVLFESSVANGNPSLTVKANSPAGEADIVADRADTGASATHQFATGGSVDWRFGTPNFTSGEPNRLDLSNTNGTVVETFHQNGNISIGKTTAATALDVNGTVTATGFSGNGAGLTNLSGVQLPAGLLTNNQSGVTLNGSFSGNGSGLTNLNVTVPSTIVESNITIGATNVIAPLTVPPAVPASAIGSVGTGSDPQSVAIAGRYAYVVNYTASGPLQIFDLSNPQSPVLVGSASTGSLPLCVAVAGRYAYVLNQNSGTLQIFDVSVPSAPVNVGTAATGNSPIAVAVAGRYAYVLNESGNTLQIFDVSVPSAPVSVGLVSTGAGSYPTGIAVAGRYAYVADQGTSMLQIIDVSVPSAPVSVGSVGTGNYPYSVAVSGSYAYVVNFNGANTLQVFNVSTPSAPVLVGTVSAGTNPYSVAVAGRYAYVVGFDSLLRIFDVSSPSAPFSIGSVGTGSYPNSIAVSGRYAYVTDAQGNALQVFDLGGAYIQQLEAGAMETGTLQTRDTITAGNNLNVRGGLTVNASARISGGLSVDNINIAGGFTTNVVISGHTLYITNGIIMNVQ